MKLGSVGRYCAGFLQVGKGLREHDRVTDQIICGTKCKRERKICCYRVVLSVLDPRKCEYLKDCSLDFEHAYVTTYLAS